MAQLCWVDERWHLFGRGIHAGETLELRAPDGWITGRVESCERGRVLVFHANLLGLTFIRTIEPENDQLRWIG